MKKLIGTLLCVMAFSFANSQDIIIKNDKSEIKCKVLEITETAVKYKNWDNLDGPIYSVLKTEVFMVRYENGKTESFDDVAKPEAKKKEVADPTEKKEMKRTFRFGSGSFNPLLNSISSMGNPGSSYNIMFQYLNLPTTTTRWAFGASIQVMGASALNYENQGFDVHFSGVGIISKCHYNWYRSTGDNSASSFYSGLSLGGIFGSASVSDTSQNINADISGFAFQFDFFGCQWHYKHIGLFAEIGFGYEGVLKSGIQIVW